MGIRLLEGRKERDGKLKRVWFGIKIKETCDSNQDDHTDSDNVNDSSDYLSPSSTDSANVDKTLDQLSVERLFRVSEKDGQTVFECRICDFVVYSHEGR